MTEDQNRTLQDKFMLRLPDGMRERIRVSAERNNRSMNAEILATLEEKYPSPVEYDFQAFKKKWLVPIYENEDFSKDAALIAAADAAAKKIHPALSVWKIAKGRFTTIKFGIRQPRKFSEEQLSSLTDFMRQVHLDEEE